MKISKKAYYGLRALVALARYPDGVSVHTLAQAEDLPEDYLKKILQTLKKKNLVTAEKGTQGGYTLSRSPEHINSWEVIETLDGGFHLIASHKRISGAKNPFPCPTLTHCQTRLVWDKLANTLRETLEHTTLADLIPKKIVSPRGSSPLLHQ